MIKPNKNTHGENTMIDLTTIRNADAEVYEAMKQELDIVPLAVEFLFHRLVHFGVGISNGR